ncbi:MAG: tandem-95 repeat protein [Hyphomicrobiales bacterium]|nr:tandem-95 repeat protein [Hyphomicrobiales bacterium]
METETAFTNEDTPLLGIDVLSNDTDPDGDVLFVSEAFADNGIVTINDDGTLDYTPNANFFGKETITYTVSDGNGGTGTGTVFVTVGPVNDDPVANDDAVSTNEDTPLNIDALANDVDVDADTLSIFSPTALHGSVFVNEDDGTLNYTPDDDFNGTDTITYWIEDGNDGTDTGEVTVTVAPVDDIADDSASTMQDTPVTIDVLSNDTFENEGARVSDFTQGDNGSVFIGTGDSLTYTPNEGFFGTDTFEYTVTSGGVTETATVTVTVDETPAVISIVQSNPGDFDFIFDSAFYQLDDNGDPFSFGVEIIDEPSTTQFTLQNSADTSRITEFFGSGFTYDTSGEVPILTGGTIDRVIFSFDNGETVQTLATADGLDVSAVEFFDAVAKSPDDNGLALDLLFESYQFNYTGSEGADSFSGGLENDTIAGGAGMDTVTGDAGADIFIIDQLDVGVGDLITDYNAEELDVIDLTALFQVISDNEESLTNFVRINPEDSTKLQVDVDGFGERAFWEDVATLDTTGGVNILYNLDGTDTSETI